MRWRGLAAIAAAILCIAAASDPSERMADPAKEARARALFSEIRCLVCQNESIDDSEAPLAADLRRLVREELGRGKSETEIRRMLVARYGEFVLLKPGFSGLSAALWLSPFLIVALSGGWLLLRRRRSPDAAELTQDEETRLAALAPSDATDTIDVTIAP